MSNHSRFSPSAAHRWMVCPGSVHLSKTVPSIPSPYALDGTIAHQAAYEWITKGKCPKKITIEGAKHPVTNEENIFKVTEGVKEAIEVYVDQVNFYSHLYKTKPLLEQKLSVPSISDEFYGTTDCVFDVFMDRLIVIDYKNGYQSVNAENNSQLAYYALGAIDKFGVDYDEVEMMIVQPNSQDGIKIKKWIAPTERFIETWQEKFLAAKLAVELSPERYEAGEHCQFCNAAPVCPEIHKQAIMTAKMEFGENPIEPEFPEPESLSMKQLLRVLDYGDMINSYIKKCRTFALYMLNQGKEVPTYKLVSKRSKRIWGDEKTTIKALRKEGITEDSIFEKRKLKSPAQIEKIVSKDFVKKYAIKPATENTIAHVNDKRKKVKPTIQTDFENEEF